MNLNESRPKWSGARTARTRPGLSRRIRPDRPLRWRVVDWVDEWAHRRGFGQLRVEGHPWRLCRWWWRATPFPYLCSLRERSYGVPRDIARGKR